MEPEVSILLATYNSERFLKEQIDSIITQTYQNWKLIIQDGGSTDSTINIIESYLLKYKNKISFFKSSKRLNACQNFATLIPKSKSPYIMFTDHDDVWEKFKVKITMDKMLESEVNKDSPICVFTDLKVVDENLNTLSKSMFKYANINPDRTKLSYQLVQNVPTGCTMLINQPLINLVQNIPDSAVMHDHWISLTATCFGKLVFLKEPTILYRQHNSNFYGVKSYGLSFYINKLNQGFDKAINRFLQNVNQANAFKQHFKSKLSTEEYTQLDMFSRIQSFSFPDRLKTVIKYSILKNGIIRNTGMVFILFLLKH